MHGYPQFSFWISKALAKFCFLRLVLNRAKMIIPVLVGTTHRKTEYLDRDAQNVCAVTKVGTVHKERNLRNREI